MQNDLEVGILTNIFSSIMLGGGRVHDILKWGKGDKSSYEKWRKVDGEQDPKKRSRTMN